LELFIKILRKLTAVLSFTLAAVCIYALIINVYVCHVGSKRIVDAETAESLEDIDAIIVLGCQVKPGGELSPMLRDRLITGVGLYEAGAAPKLLMSGDHSDIYYDEVNAMKNYAMSVGVPSSDIFMDHAGLSTYESMYRAKEVYQCKRVIIVTQSYHLYRALYVAKQLGLDAYGVSADRSEYTGQLARDFREILARNKDFLITIYKPEPTYLGDVIPITGDGDVTNDKD